MAKVIATCGRICCGKTTYAKSLIKKSGGVLLSCDEITLGVLGGQLGDRHDEILQRIQQYLLTKALEILRNGSDVVLDWGLWTSEERSRIRNFFIEHGFEYELHYLDIPEGEWMERIKKRNLAVTAEKSCESYLVDEGLLRKASLLFEPPSDDEICLVI